MDGHLLASLEKETRLPVPPAIPIGLPTSRQLIQPAQDKGLAPVGMIGVVKPQVRQAAQQRPDRNLAFDAGELCAQTVMYSAAERQRAYVGTCDIEPIRIRVDRGVAIGRAEQAQH